jgi:hypothetical protein
MRVQGSAAVLELVLGYVCLFGLGAQRIELMIGRRRGQYDCRPSLRLRPRGWAGDIRDPNN